MLSILIPLILPGQIAASICASKNITDYGDSVINKDLNNGYLAAEQALENYFWGIEYRMTTMSMTGIIQRDLAAGDFTNTLGILSGLKGATDVSTGTVFRSETGDNLSVPTANYISAGMSSVIEDAYYERAKEKESIWVGPYEDKLTGVITLSESMNQVAAVSGDQAESTASVVEKTNLLSEDIARYSEQLHKKLDMFQCE